MLSFLLRLEQNVIENRGKLSCKSITMQPDDLSMPRGDNKIKEKLNLHVKKRIQETAKTSTIAEPLTPPPPPSSAGPSTSAAAPPAVPGPSSGPKTKKQKTKHSPAALTASTATTSSSFNLAGGSSGSGKPPTAEHLMLSPGALGGGNSNDTTNSSFNSVDLDPDANLSNDGPSAEKSSPGGSGSKATSKPDIFTMILNEKKSSLMRDPEVIKFLRDLMEKRDKP